MVELSGKSNERPAALAGFETALRVPVGAASPLWFMFAGAASAGVAYWWMARWSRPVNLEAFFAAGPDAGLVLPAAEAVAEPGLEAAAAIVEAIEPLLDPEAETEALEAAVFAPEPPPAPAPAAVEVEPAPPAEAAAEAPEAQAPVAEAPAADATPVEPAAQAARPAAKKATAKAKGAASRPAADS